MAALNVRSSQSVTCGDDNVFRNVPNLPGVVTCPALMEWFFGIVSCKDLLCCILCPRLTLLNLSTCPDHYKDKHAPEIKRLPRTRILNTCKQFNVYAGLAERNVYLVWCLQSQLDEYPRPPWPTPVLFFLPDEPAWLCLICDATGDEYIAKVLDTRQKHYQSRHKGSRTPFEKSELQILAQSYTPAYYRVRKFFRVEPNANALEKVNEETGVLPAAPADLLTTFIDMWSPALLVRPDVTTLKQVMPFLYHSGYADHLKDLDHLFLLSLTARPKRGDPLHVLYTTVVNLFLEEQKALAKTPEPIRINVMNEGQGSTDLKVFKAMGAESQPDYANTMALWCVFVCRMLRSEENQTSTYLVQMTKAQRRAVGWAMELANEIDGHASPVRVVGLLAQAFWSPDYANRFDNMVDDQFNDPTMRFSVIMCLREDGTVYTPRNAANELVRIKYAIRFGMFLWAREICFIKKKSINDIPSMVGSALTRRRLSPFACISTTTSHATAYAATSTTLPHVLWLPGGRHLLLEGQRLSWDAMRHALAAEAKSLRKFLLEEIFFGITPESMGFNITHQTHIFDNQSSAAEGYSMFTEQRNPFFRLRFALVSAILNKPELAAKFFLGLSEDSGTKEIVWNLPGVKDWLEKIASFSRRLTFLMHACSGQPGRGTEMALLKLYNTKLRLRNFYCLGA
ncbi:hypothetical protein FRC07_007866, partial [Ceratobasidium sp. 392]